ncbi:MAG: hypothetical protein HOP33_04655 [Verrucomicrobia bacterium]|nr:hypothetical protein [Verrucomicrobiota bacterium]
MKTISTILAVVFVLASVGCQSNKHASRTVAPKPQISYAFDESFYKYFEPKLEYAFDDRMRSYFGPHTRVALERALAEAQPGYQIHVSFENSVK